MNKRGFSILEMTITITIIAMIVAAITAGSNLKTKLELDQVVTDISNITSANKQFKTTYNAMPGDFFTATSSISSTTSNGDGNNYLNGTEPLLFWQHLALAGLITGTYDGTTNGIGGKMQPSIKHGVYSAIKASGGLLNISVSRAIGTDGVAYGLFTTRQAYNYDTKYDDGDPSRGTIRAGDGSGETAGNCYSGTAYTLTYTDTTPCVLYFYLEQ
jgi:prepilin-type N-terminal cleavage/methylation domain-containing protein